MRYNKYYLYLLDFDYHNDTTVNDFESNRLERYSDIFESKYSLFCVKHKIKYMFLEKQNNILHLKYYESYNAVLRFKASKMFL